MAIPRQWGVDVKGNNLPDEIWCEFKNVQGNPGWMYGGSNIIAFDLPEEGGFSIVSTKELREYCELNVPEEFVGHKSKAYKKMYSRKDRHDVITKLNLGDLKSMLSYRVWKYFTTSFLCDLLIASLPALAILLSLPSLCSTTVNI